jgi:hypothetical protein
MRGVLIGLAACAYLATACGGGGRDTPVLAAQPPAATATAAAPGAAGPHGDHNPKFGGIVLMNGDLHFEVVLRRDGRHRIYFSDATRSELPAATASGLALTIERTGEPPETVAMRIDDSGESWIGSGRVVDDGRAATARVAYTAYGKPYFIDVPFPR